ncbi:hypothetical protein AAV94_01110 [Lampropedia cohaerens]|uniref:Thiamine-phosphate synthase n=1 Tax=Lampropedia cohaerens TaxID=1610491 RepID=A0A0U1Q2R5_9BURK|nr:thiamine phosphate synthase [Lampropedia cohaerens]KKW69041.1 hypothetical protein AAV94_01110 [Lampropedia cohaerens]
MMPPCPSRPDLLAHARLYLCTDSLGLTEHAFGDFCAQLFEAGVDIIQLRDKRMEAAQELQYFAALREAARRTGSLFAANDRADIAQLAETDILHLGQGDLPLASARGLVGPQVLLGQSTHSGAQARAAMASEADYFCIGPVWPTPTKPGRAAVGLDAVADVAHACQASGCTKPWFAIGDVTLEKLPQLLAAGARRVVVVRAITQAMDPPAAAAALKAALQQVA